MYCIALSSVGASGVYRRLGAMTFGNGVVRQASRHHHIFFVCRVASDR
jgi:hypothetical protein